MFEDVEGGVEEELKRYLKMPQVEDDVISIPLEMDDDDMGFCDGLSQRKNIYRGDKSI